MMNVFQVLKRCVFSEDIFINAWTSCVKILNEVPYIEHVCIANQNFNNVWEILCTWLITKKLVSAKQKKY